MHKYINDHRIHTLVALEQETLYYTHETRDTSDTPCPNIITIFRSAPMKNANPDVISTVRILYPPRMAGRSGFVNYAVCMGENLLRNAIDRDMSPIEATGFFKRRYAEGNSSYGKYFKDNYDGMHMTIGFGSFPYGLGDTTVTIRLYFGHEAVSYIKHDCEVSRHIAEYFSSFYDGERGYNEHVREAAHHVGLLDAAPPNLKKLCNSLIDGSVKGNLNGVPVVSITRRAVKEYNELEAKYQSACGQISEYEEENRKLKEKLEEINKLVKSAIPDQDPPKEHLKFMGEER